MILIQRHGRPAYAKAMAGRQAAMAPESTLYHHKEGMRSTFAKAAAGRQARRGRRPLLLMTQEPIVGFANA
jgi:hypothetical protein